MSTESREHLSCLMDGEISRDTGRFLVRRLGADQELCATWARYHLVRDCLRNPGAGFASADLSSRVRQAIEREAQPAARRRGVPRWLKPMAGAAVAASVALLAVLAVGPGRQPVDTGPVAGGEVVAAGSFTSPQGLTPSPASSQVSLSGGDSANRINPYLLRHYQATGSTNGKGFVSFVPIVITPAARSESKIADAAEPPAGAAVTEAEGTSPDQ